MSDSIDATAKMRRRRKRYRLDDKEYQESMLHNSSNRPLFPFWVLHVEKTGNVIHVNLMVLILNRPFHFTLEIRSLH
ncbi:hypothetical protein Q73_06210 [Bacillus coahuilensis m2-6]|uniref:hypothetical protein n=1 Tax=Bacillus coahuilensis TaxID=408580 RepID=UPI0001850DAD|nr:hypothetical protein [Bacillus coahuilensis]KUP08338.1 hypothetical protein Q73_06210 [Bacillus coahuilensis m2-6]